MRRTLEQDLEELDRLAFQRRDWCEGLVRELHRLRAVAAGHPDFALLEQGCAWLFAPYTLWPVEMVEVCERLQAAIAGGGRVEQALRLLLEMLGPVPPAEVQEPVAAHEHAVRRGCYRDQLKAQEKYTLAEAQLAENPALQAGWEAIRAGFPVA